ncbi:sensor histidine kinase [Blastococcus xanthinilyticus]|uniref:histidine kinase n=1 Tax=Blastococcus xanthinilyticus TaxID=1564164 RepID=A0A5S5CP63_9ACTN|nr:HAMP domain-containing sensor histidine kinase [Blastococcus xanthinilyticus]TYP80647.1 signal transduction histidine kinase [Blastococcus xanthinilyticus]
MSRVPGRRGLRARIVLGFAASTLLVSAVLVTTTWLLARSYVVEQREQALTQQAFADADVLRNRMSTAGADVGRVLGELVPFGDAEVVVRSGEDWFSSSLDVGGRNVPGELQDVVATGAAGAMRVETPDGPQLVVAVPVVSAGIEFYAVSPLDDLERLLRTLALVLGAGACVATLAGAGFGAWASRRAVLPLEQVAGAATRIAGGELSTRLPATDDPDLVGIVAAFNSMVDALSARISRDARFVGDVSHELRSPLTSLTTSVEVLATRRQELPARAQEALALVEGEVTRLRVTLDDLLQLAWFDGAGPLLDAAPVSMGELVREVLEGTGRDVGLLVAEPGDGTTVLGDKSRLERAVRNLLDNADRYGDGPVRVAVHRCEGTVLVTVDDAGPGVPVLDRERIFERFARAPGSARRSVPGAGLGLAIVAETTAQHGGTAECADSPAGGARFVLSLPAARS